MRIEDLERAVAKEDWRAIRRGAARLTEAQRAALAEPAVEIASSLLKGRGGSYRRANDMPERLSRHTQKRGSGELSDMHQVAELALYAFAGPKQLPRSLPDHVEYFEPAVVQILDERRPPWLASWIAQQLARDVKDQVITWRVVRPLTQRGAIAKPKTDGYIALLASPWTRHVFDFEDTTPCDLLLADRALLKDEVWKLFEVDTRAFRRDTYHDPSWDWASALAKLAGEGHLDRQRLLDATLSALAARFQPTTHAGLCVLHDLLAPTSQECAKRAAAYRRLASHKVARVKKLATAALSPPNSKPRTASPKQTKAMFPPPPQPWKPRWKPTTSGKVELAQQPIGSVVAYRVEPWHYILLKVADDKWLHVMGLDSEADALADWRKFAAKPPHPRSSYFMTDAKAMAELAQGPPVVRIAASR